MAATSLALTTPPTVSAQQSPPAAAQSAEEVQNAPPPERTDTTLRGAPMPVDAMPLDEPPARASAITRQAPGAALSQAQWNRRPVAQRGQTPQLKQEWRATDIPNREVVPGGMRSDREEIPAGFTKAEADLAETMEAALAGGEGAMRALVAPGCQVYWPAPYEVCGAIRDKYNELGGPNSFLLFPKTNELTNPDGIGKRTEFLNGPIYWSPQGGAHPVVNHFLAAWARHGYENSYIGHPATDEIVNPDGIGRRQHFTGSTIYWHVNEAYSVGGAIADKWHTLGAEQGLLGYPISDERVLPDGVGRMNRFQRGVIYWHPSTGAHYVNGNILDQWSSAGYEMSRFGYPIDDPSNQGDILSSQKFQHGILNSPSIPVNLARRTDSFSLGFPSIENPQLRAEGSKAIIEDVNFAISMWSGNGNRSLDYSISFKNPDSHPEVTLAVGLPHDLHLESRENSRISIVTESGVETASVGLPMATAESPVPYRMSYSVSGNEISIRYLGERYPAISTRDLAMDSPKVVDGKAVGDYWDAWWHRLGPNERERCELEWNDCRRTFTLVDDAEAFGFELTPNPYDNEGDAGRHCLFQATLTEAANRGFAARMAQAHEEDHRTPTGAEFSAEQTAAMDNYNNFTGQELGLRLEGNGSDIKGVCRRYAFEARVSADPASEVQNGGTDLVVLKSDLP